MNKLFNIRVKSAFYKAVRHNINSGNFIPYTVSLQKWCNSYGVPKHFDWVRNLILNEMDGDAELGAHVYLDADFYDLHLDSDGIFVFSHILNDFFGVEQVRAMRHYLNQRNTEAKLLFEIKSLVRNASPAKLNEYETAWTNCVSEHGRLEFARQVLDLIKREKARRSRFHLVCRHKKTPTGGNQ